MEILPHCGSNSNSFQFSKKVSPGVKAKSQTSERRKAAGPFQRETEV